MMKNTLKYRSILPILALTGLLSGVVGFNLSSTASAQTIAPSPSPTLVPSRRHSHRLPRRIVRRLLRNASKRLGVHWKHLKYKATPRTFGNRCVFNFGEICPKIYQPIKGWVVKVGGKGKFITYHVAKNGKFVADPKAKY
ncbi:MAG: hypothetical protein QNJ63_09600 [Calothrix sp. MO_192.B10]|nr:hypothetical protein [Calothrix sp. MO_192.B10]